MEFESVGARSDSSNDALGGVAAQSSGSSTGRVKIVRYAHQPRWRIKKIPSDGSCSSRDCKQPIAPQKGADSNGPVAKEDILPQPIVPPRGPIPPPEVVLDDIVKALNRQVTILNMIRSQPVMFDVATGGFFQLRNTEQSQLVNGNGFVFHFTNGLKPVGDMTPFISCGIIGDLAARIVTRYLPIILRKVAKARNSIAVYLQQKQHKQGVLVNNAIVSFSDPLLAVDPDDFKLSPGDELIAQISGRFGTVSSVRLNAVMARLYNRFFGVFKEGDERWLVHVVDDIVQSDFITNFVYNAGPIEIRDARAFNAAFDLSMQDRLCGFKFADAEVPEYLLSAVETHLVYCQGVVRLVTTKNTFSLPLFRELIAKEDAMLSPYGLRVSLCNKAKSAYVFVGHNAHSNTLQAIPDNTARIAFLYLMSLRQSRLENQGEGFLAATSS